MNGEPPAPETSVGEPVSPDLEGPPPSNSHAVGTQLAECHPGGSHGLGLAGMPESMRARRHPWAIVGLWLWESSVALLATCPAALLVRASYGNDPDGDRALWAPGGHALLDFLWHEAHGVSSALSSGAIVLAAAAVAGLIPMSSVLFVVAHPPRGPRIARMVRSTAAAIRMVPTMAALLVIVGICQGATMGLGVALASNLADHTHAALGEARSQQIGLLVLVPFLLVASAMGVVHDVARAAVVVRHATARRALALGAEAFRLAPARLWSSWAWRAAAGIGPMLAAGAAATHLDAQECLALALLALMHQGVVLSRAALHVSWWAKAMRSIARQTESARGRDALLSVTGAARGKAARSVEPDAPSRDRGA